MTKIRVVAAVVDTTQLLLYKEDGTTHAIPQGDPNLRRIIDDVRPIIGQGLVAEVDLSGYPETNVYADFQAQSGGLTRFFKVAKSKVASFFGVKPEEQENTVEPTIIGLIPADEAGDSQLSAAVDDIIANATPATNDRFHQEISTNDTVVAVVGQGKDVRVVPGMENLKDQFAYALKLGSTKGVQRFLERISAVIEERKHSIHDLLRFMERGDLPIADDGSIIIYKILRRQGNGYVDCHTRQVAQRVGSYVCMDAKLVDPNRRNECSNGLHVARRGYLSHFSGDVCVLAKVAPEDVIAVPNYDANKMRVCGYHILFELSDEDFRTLKSNRPMTGSTPAQKLLGRAIAGNHSRPLEEVRITSARGGGVITKRLDGSSQPRSTKALPAKALDDTVGERTVDPRQVAAEVAEAKAAAPAPTPRPTAGSSPRMEKARQLFNAKDWTGLHAHKRAVKVSWASLGFSEPEQQAILAGISSKPGTMAPAAVARQEKVVSAIAPIAEQVTEADEPAPQPAKTPNLKAKVMPEASTNPRQTRAQLLFDGATDPKASLSARRSALAALRQHKAKTKVSWETLGLNQGDIQLLINTLGQETAATSIVREQPGDGRPAGERPKKTAKVSKPKAPAPLPEPTGSRSEIARAYFDRQEWSKLLAHKKKVKLSWTALGFNQKRISTILLHIGD